MNLSLAPLGRDLAPDSYGVPGAEVCTSGLLKWTTEIG